jgi:L-threonylcarbamoyladenylate synthase
MTILDGRDDKAIAVAADAMQRGELVAIPTETVYGLGALITIADAVTKIFVTKERPSSHPLIIHAPSIDHFSRFAVIDGRAEILADSFWPGPLTMLLKATARLDRTVTGGRDTVAIRVPRHDIALALLASLDSPVAAPSANRFGRVSPTSAPHVNEEFGRQLLVLDGGPCQVGVESTIVDLTASTPQVVRLGAVSAQQLASVLDCNVVTADALSVVNTVSGTMLSHYSPLAHLRLVEHAPDGDVSGELWNADHLGSTSAEWAHNLYDALRGLDARGVPSATIVVPQFDDSLGAAVVDRLRRAASQD